MREKKEGKKLVTTHFRTYLNFCSCRYCHIETKKINKKKSQRKTDRIYYELFVKATAI